MTLHVLFYSDQPLLDRQRKVINKMLDAGRGGFEGGLTNRKYQSMANVSRATAIRELKQLVDMGLLKFAPGETRGRNVSYDINW